MPKIISPGTIRIAMLGHWSSMQSIVTVIHTARQDPSTAVTDAEMLTQVGKIRDAWQDDIMDTLSSFYTFDGVQAMSLHSLDAPVLSLAPNAAKPLVGFVSGVGTPPPPPSVCALVKKRIIARRGLRSGRMYLNAIGETEVDQNGTLNAAVLLRITTAINSFYTDCGGLSTTSNFGLAVVHAPFDYKDPPLVAYGTPSPVTSLTADPLVATQRGRVR